MSEPQREVGGVRATCQRAGVTLSWRYQMDAVILEESWWGDELCCCSRSKCRLRFNVLHLAGSSTFLCLRFRFQWNQCVCSSIKTAYFLSISPPWRPFWSFCSCLSLNVCQVIREDEGTAVIQKKTNAARARNQINRQNKDQGKKLNWKETVGRSLDQKDEIIYEYMQGQELMRRGGRY